ncbi:MAG: hypothetical protein DHS20C01_12940 [marine bacterium B5-7]|nr:MAG: hypothetical protein DHS20C01_12940 [marine bacterium B5-7]
MTSKRVTTDRFDASGTGCVRMLKIVLLWKMLGISGVANGPRIGDLLAINSRIFFGRHAAIISVKYERQWRNWLTRYRRTRLTLLRRGGLIRDKLMGRLDS